MPLLLTGTQEEWLWMEAIRAAPREILSLADTAAQCRDAWRLTHAWRLPRVAGNEDAQAFQEWAAAYERRSAGEIDAARLPDRVAAWLGELKRPQLLVAYAFDLLPPQSKAFLDAMAAHGVEVVECKPAAQDAAVTRVSYASTKEELEKAASWARFRLEDSQENPLKKIGIVFPDLQLRRKEVVRVFSRILRPGCNLPGAAAEALPFNVSIGVPLAEHPIVALALDLLRLSRDELPFTEVSRILLSPFLGGAESELSQRARMEAKLRYDLPASVSLPKLIGLLDRSILREKLEALIAVARDDLLAPQTPSDWARHFSALLDAAGYPGERGLDSAEFQARAKLNEVLGELSRLERVHSRCSFREAFGIFNRLCSETLFQPESPDAPIQVLGILESAGLAFDHLWVAGLTDEAWPLQARPNPFLPPAVQRKAGIPEASAEGSLELDRRLTEGWKTAAAEVVFSSYDKDADRTLAPSPLIAEVPKGTLDVPSFPRYRDLIFASRNLSSIADRVAPEVKATRMKGGTRVLADQAACPFRAFARHRLGARPLEEPADGLDAAARGSLLHALMKHLWLLLKDSSSLSKNISKQVQEAADAAVKELGLEGRFAELERQRLQRLAAEWLDAERERPPFEVVATEKPMAFRVAGIEYTGRIDRMDRLVASRSAGHALIDYKTGRAPTPKVWEAPRPEDPQLPLYALHAEEDIAAVAFAKLRPGDMKLMGFSRDEGAIPGVKKAKAWEPLLRGWKEEAERLGAGFKAGEAAVDPKRGLATCRNCDLHTVCRVYEKISVLSEDSSSEEE